ncbi:MAG: hypothetical protein U0411_00010 [Thermodesulfovibrionales bacterium]
MHLVSVYPVGHEEKIQREGREAHHGAGVEQEAHPVYLQKIPEWNGEGRERMHQEQCPCAKGDQEKDSVEIVQDAETVLYFPVIFHFHLV